MKNSIFVFLFLGLIGCSTNTTDKSNTQNLDWILGNWQRTNDEEGKQTFEHWEKISDKEYKGLGFTHQAKDTVFKENMRLIPIDNIWNLEVTGVNENPTFFHFTNQTKNSFICENPNNEFPKKIKYFFDDKKLKAKVSSEEFEIDFEFEKIKKSN